MSRIQVFVFPDADEATAHGFNYNEWDKRPLSTNATTAVIVRHGTEGGNATVDFISEDKDGNKQVFMITASLLAGIVVAATQK